MPKIREYSKMELRALMADPSVNLETEKWQLTARLKHRESFYAEVLPIVEQHCKKIISLEDFKKKKVIPVKVVEVLFKHLEL